MSKTGVVKFHDRFKGYGYIIASDASGPRDTVMFTHQDCADLDAPLPSGELVTFDVDTLRPRHAINVTAAPR